MAEKKQELKEIIHEVTIRLPPMVVKVVGKRERTKRAVKEVVKYAQRRMHTKDVKVDPDLNKFIWSRGIKNPPRRVRVRLHRKKRAESNRLYTVCSWVPTANFKGKRVILFGLFA